LHPRVRWSSFFTRKRLILSIAYLPSTFAMYGVTLAHALSIKPPSKSRTIQVFSTIGITAILSWPFAIVLATVLAIQDLAQLEWSKTKIRDFNKAVFLAIVLVLLVLVFISSRNFLLTDRALLWLWTLPLTDVFRSCR